MHSLVAGAAVLERSIREISDKVLSLFCASGQVPCWHVWDAFSSNSAPASAGSQCYFDLCVNNGFELLL